MTSFAFSLSCSSVSFAQFVVVSKALPFQKKKKRKRARVVFREKSNRFGSKEVSLLSRHCWLLFVGGGSNIQQTNNQDLTNDLCEFIGRNQRAFTNRVTFSRIAIRLLQLHQVYGLCVISYLHCGVCNLLVSDSPSVVDDRSSSLVNANT
jgi:hypothetical protein